VQGRKARDNYTGAVAERLAIQLREVVVVGIHEVAEHFELLAEDVVRERAEEVGVTLLLRAGRNLREVEGSDLGRGGRIVDASKRGNAEILSSTSLARGNPSFEGRVELTFKQGSAAATV